MKVLVDSASQYLLRALAMAAYPREGCGILLGHRDGETCSIDDVRYALNRCATDAGDQYELDPEDVVHARLEAQEQGLEVVGYWHSHPDSSADPSQFDSQHAQADCAYLICATASEGSRDVRAFAKSQTAALEPVTLEIEASQ